MSDNNDNKEVTSTNIIANNKNEPKKCPNCGGIITDTDMKFYKNCRQKLE